MSRPIAVQGAGAAGASSEAGADASRLLLACGGVAGPLYVVLGFGQAFTRPGFDLERHALSLLSNGDLGWVQIANFVVSGLLVVAGALGMRRVLRGSRGGTWGPLLVGVFGVSLVAAGAFTADPMDGFPPGTPPGPPASISWHGLAHFAAGAVGFLALIAACVVFARRFAALGQRRWAACSLATGVLFLAAFLGIASGSGGAATNLGFVAGILLAWSWLTVLAARLRRGER